MVYLSLVAKPFVKLSRLATKNHGWYKWRFEGQTVRNVFFLHNGGKDFYFKMHDDVGSICSVADARILRSGKFLFCDGIRIFTAV